MDMEDRFWAKVNKDGPTPTHVDYLGPCWVWTAATNRGGYGVFGIIRTVNNLAHRVAWQLEHGGIPEGMCVCHHCDNPPCVRPDHMYLGTLIENNEDMARKGRQKLPPALRGNQISTCKLTPNDVMKIRADHAAGVGQGALATEMGVTQANISQIVRCKTWKYVT